MATIASLAIAAVGAAVAAYANYASAQQQQDNLRNPAFVEEYNASVQEEAGREAARRQRKSDEAAQNSFRARAASANVVAGAPGSALLKELDFAGESELQAQNVQHVYDVKAAEMKTSANFNKWQADRISPATSAGISLLSSASSIAGSYGTMGAGKGAGSQTGGGLNTGPGIYPRVSTSDYLRSAG